MIFRVVAIHTIILSISFGFIYPEEQDHFPHQPFVCLRKISIRVISTLKTRTPQFYNGKQQPADYEDSMNVLLRQSFARIGAFIYKGLRVVYVRTGKETLDALDFQSYGLNLSHIIEVMLWVEFVGERKKVLVCQGPITIVLGIADTVMDTMMSLTNDVGRERDTHTWNWAMRWAHLHIRHPLIRYKRLNNNP
jgi:hypothetical protein